jgi:hypothetical protein
MLIPSPTKKIPLFGNCQRFPEIPAKKYPFPFKSEMTEGVAWGDGQAVAKYEKSVCSPRQDNEDK